MTENATNSLGTRLEVIMRGYRHTNAFIFHVARL